jgi:hypothetical protein
MTKVFIIGNCDAMDHTDVDPADRGRLIGRILSDRRCKFTPEQLAAKSLAELDAIAGLISGSKTAAPPAEPSLNSKDVGPARVESPHHLPTPPPFSEPSTDVGDPRLRGHLPHPQ